MSKPRFAERLETIIFSPIKPLDPKAKTIIARNFNA